MKLRVNDWRLVGPYYFVRAKCVEDLDQLLDYRKHARSMSILVSQRSARSSFSDPACSVHRSVRQHSAAYRVTVYLCAEPILTHIMLSTFS